MAADLQAAEDGWRAAELAVEPGAYRYHFLLDGFLRMNDPDADGYKMPPAAWGTDPEATHRSPLPRQEPRTGNGILLDTSAYSAFMRGMTSAAGHGLPT